MTAPPLPDGDYDAIVVDAAPSETGGVALELTILAGDHKGEVVQVAAPASADDPTLLLGIPATLTVESGTPHVELEP